MNKKEKSEKSVKVKRVTEIDLETADSIRGGKTCNCSCQTQNERAATTLNTYVS